MSSQHDDDLEQARRRCGLTGDELWLRYFALGGMTEPFHVEAVLYGLVSTTDHDHDQIAHALNERFTELGANHPVPYRVDLGPDLLPDELG